MFPSLVSHNLQDLLAFFLVRLGGVTQIGLWINTLRHVVICGIQTDTPLLRRHLSPT